ncbi:restriction endonuclease subunit S [Streptomonospora litoralis]|uniref:EcoKI restriction-modification system protein HsdS n=1 Tax=Streptomonospora litoralis TaxID=2498135 RepID=A0A4P6Q529_9ACTN|nr:restriction endonuclease subunit S [Streptomonospora litoralis]QBI55765.1 EcoKI restriction-modification system protein HsdS [Streptomonospora litoralis]
MDALIGQLPSDWREQPLGEICSIQAGPSGAGMSSRAFTSHGTPVVRPGDISRRSVTDTGLARVDDATADHLKRYRLKSGDIVGARTGTLGRFALITPEQEGWLYNTQILRLRPSPENDSAYLVHYLALPAVQKWIARHASGSTVRSITQRTMQTLPTAVPSLNIQQAIGQALCALDDKARLHAEISRTTDELRETVAPMLLSGRVPPGEASDRQVSEGSGEPISSEEMSATREYWLWHGFDESPADAGSIPQ